jgi:predicted metal-dependent phosphoesterase TrpH
MEKPSIDLHMHSFYSDDGEFSPEALAERCAQQGIYVMAVSDHNCVRANRAAAAAAQTAGIRCLSAVEIDCTLEGVGFHVLGYGIDAEDPCFAQIEENVAAQGAAASEKMLAATRRLGFGLSEAEMRSAAKGHMREDVWTGEMFAEVLLAKPEYAETSILQPYRPGGARSDNPYVNFYWDFYAQGRSCYVPVVYPAMAEIVDTIHRTGGRAVLAHPGVNLHGHEELLALILRLEIDGIEAFSSYHTPKTAAYYYSAATEAGLLVTCGSDFHGKTKPAISLGQTGSTLSEEEMLRGLERFGLLESRSACV